MKIFMTVTFDDGADGRVEEITIGPRDQYAWEKAEPGRSIGSVLAEHDRIQDHYSLAFAALRRQGKFSGSLRELTESADVEIGHKSKTDVEDRSDEDPTQTGPSADE